MEGSWLSSLSRNSSVSQLTKPSREPGEVPRPWAQPPYMCLPQMGRPPRGDRPPRRFWSLRSFMFGLTKGPCGCMAQLLAYVDFLAKDPELQDNWQCCQSTGSSGRARTQFHLLTPVVVFQQIGSTLDPRALILKARSMDSPAPGAPSACLADAPTSRGSPERPRAQVGICRGCKGAKGRDPVLARTS